MAKKKMRKDGRFEVTATIDGKRYHFYGETQHEARQKRDEFVDMMGKCPLADKKITLAEWCEAWLETITQSVAWSTKISYADVLHRFIIRAPIGSVLLTDLKPQMFRVYWQQLLDEGKASRTVIYCHTVTNMALKQALYDGAIYVNPLSAVKRPKLVKKEIVAMTKEQLHTLLEAVDDPLYKNIFIVGARTGMRREEILGLTWPNINFERGQLTVQKTVIRTDGKMHLVDTTKTKSSRRTISLDDEALDVLREQQVIYLRYRLAGGKRFEDLELVFCRENGKPIHPDSVTQWFRRYADRCGLHQFTFHSLRHTHATLLLEAGVNFKIVQTRLGHSSFTTTMDTYAHVTPAMEADVVNVIKQSI